MKRAILVLISFSLVATISVAEGPPEVLHFPASEFNDFVALSVSEIDTQDQWGEWIESHGGKIAMPTSDGHYLVYTNDSILGPYNIFFGPFSKEPVLERDRLKTRVRAAAKTRPSLIDSQVRLIDAEELARIDQVGAAKWARAQAMAKSRSSRAITHMAEEVGARTQPGLSDTERLQLLATRNAEILDTVPEGVLGRTLSAIQATTLDRQLGRHVLEQVVPTMDIDEMLSTGINATEIETLFLTLSDAITSKGEDRHPDWTWADDSTAGWAMTELRAALYPSGTPEALNTQQADQALQALGRLLPAAAAKHWGLSTAQVLAETPAMRELERISDRLGRHGAPIPAEIIQNAVSATGTSIPDNKDIGFELLDRFRVGASYPMVPQLDVDQGRDALVKASKNLPDPDLTAAELNKWLEEGASNADVQRIANVSQKLIGDLPTIEAIGQSARDAKPTSWSKQEVHDLIGRIGEAERRARTAESLDENHDVEISLADAVTDGVTAENREALEKALGEAAGATPADAEAKGEQLLADSNANPAGSVSSDQAAQAAEAAATEGNHEPSGEPGDANDGGKGDRAGTGAIPVQSLPVLEMLARLLAQYFGVESYLKQAAMLVYMFAGDLVEQLVDQLEGLNEAFGDDLNDIAGDVNALLDTLGPYMGDIGALADSAVDQGLERAADELTKLAEQKFEEAAIQELKKTLADELKIDPSLVDIEGALSMASDFSMEALTAYAEDAVEDAANDAATRLLADAGLPTEVLDAKNWDEAGKTVISHLKSKATNAVSSELGFDSAIGNDITNLALAGNWTEVGNKLVTHGKDKAIDEAVIRSGLPKEVLQDPTSVPDKINELIGDVGAVASLLGEQVPTTTKELMDLAKGEAVVVANRVIEKQLSEYRESIQDPELQAMLDSFVSDGPDVALSSATKSIKSQLAGQTATLRNALAAASGVHDANTIGEAVTELNQLGALNITPELVSAIKQHTDPANTLYDHVFSWAAGRWRLNFTASQPCAVAVEASDAETIRNACSQWLKEAYGGSTQTIENKLAADPTLISLIKNSGDRDALARALLQFAIRSSNKGLPSDLRNEGWQQVASIGLDGAIDEWANDAAVRAQDDLEARTDTSALAAVFSELKKQDYTGAANTVFSRKTDPAIQQWMSDDVREAFQIEDTGELIDTLSNTLRSAADSAGTEALSRDTDFGVVADVASCIRNSAASSTCESTSKELTESALNAGLSEQNDDLRHAILNQDPTLAAASHRVEIEASIQTALDGESLSAVQCFPADDPGCVFRETQLIPSLRKRYPDMSEDAARKLVADPGFSLRDLKSFAASASTSEELASSLGTSSSSLQSFASIPSVLDDPSAKHQLKQALLSESLRSVVGDTASQELLKNMSQGNVASTEGHCVEVKVRAFIPSDELKNEYSIVPVPGRANAWMIPGPLAVLTGYEGIPLSQKAREAIKEPSAETLRTCYVGDNRGYSNSPNASSRVWASFTLRVGETAFELDSSSIQKGTHETESVHCETGATLDKAQASADPIKIQQLQSDAATPGATVYLAGKNPLVPSPFSPLLELQGNFTYSRENLEVKFSGTREAFPSYEAYARLNGGDWQTVFKEGPEKGASAFSIADYGILSTEIDLQGSARLPGLSSACRVPQDDARRQALRRAAAEAFRKSVDHCVTFTEVMRMAADKAPNLGSYLEDLRLVLIGSDVRRRQGKRGPYYIGSGLTNDTGFKAGFEDNSPQVEHAMWGIYASKIVQPGGVGGLGTIVESFQAIGHLLGLATEEDKYRNASVEEIMRGAVADSALYAVAGEFGSRLSNTNYKDSYRAAQKYLCTSQ